MELKILLFVTTTFSVCNAETTPCGTSLTDEDKGGGIAGREIQYKMNEYYIPGEKCVWTIRNKKTSSSSFEFTKAKSNFNSMQTYLTIHTFGVDGEALGNGTLGQFDQEQKLYMRGVLAVIIFTASQSQTNGVGVGKGFRLSYKTVGTREHYYEDRTDLIVSSRTGNFIQDTNGPGFWSMQLLVIVRNSTIMPHSSLLQEVGVSLQILARVPVEWDYCELHTGKLYRITKNQAQQIMHFNRCAPNGGPLGPFYGDDILIVFFGRRDFHMRSTFSVYWEIY